MNQTPIDSPATPYRSAETRPELAPLPKPAPRAIPRPLRMLLLFGGSAQFGWLFFAVASALTWSSVFSASSRRAPFGEDMTSLLALPLVGLALAAYRLATGYRTTKVLANGRITEGKVVSYETTVMRVGFRTLRVIRADFEAAGGVEGSAKGYSLYPPNDDDIGKIETIAYLPSAPRSGVIVRRLSGTPTVVDDVIVAEKNVGAQGTRVLIVPFLATVGNVIALGAALVR